MLNLTDREDSSDLSPVPGFAFCLRFNLALLGSIDRQFRGKVLTVADPGSNANGDCGSNSVGGRCLFDLFAVYPHSVMNIGLAHKATSSNYNSYLLQSDDTDVGYNIIYPNKWHHFCVSFRSKTGRVRVALVNSHFLFSIA